MLFLDIWTSKILIRIKFLFIVMSLLMSSKSYKQLYPKWKSTLTWSLHWYPWTSTHCVSKEQVKVADFQVDISS